MRFSGTNESDFIKLRSHENTTSSSVGERTETGRERAGAADPGRRANSMHASAEAASLSGGVAAGGGTTPLKPAWAGVEEKVSPRCTQKAKEIRSLAEHFKKVPDFRSRIQSYPIWSLLTMIALAYLCGAPRGHKDLAKFARQMSRGQRRALGIRRNRKREIPAPSRSSFMRVCQQNGTG